MMDSRSNPRPPSVDAPPVAVGLGRSQPFQSGRVRSLGLYAVGAMLCALGGIAVAMLPPQVPIGAAIGGILLALMVFRPFLTLLVYLVFFLAWPQEWISFFRGLPPFTERIVAFIAIGGGILLPQVLRRDSVIYVGRAGLAIAGILWAFSFSLLTAYWGVQVKDTLIAVARLATVYILIVGICDTYRKLQAVIWTYLIIVATMSAMSVWNYYHGQFSITMGIMRAAGLGASYSDPNSHAATILYALPVLLLMVISHRKWAQRLLLSGMGLVYLWNIILTGSRSAMIGVMFVVFVITIRSRKKVVYAFGFLLLLAVIALVMPDQYVQRLLSSADFSSNTGAAISARGRILGLQHGLLLFLHNPITGIGAGCYSAARGIEFGMYASAHNMIGQLIAETGILGFTAFVLFLVTVLKTTMRSQRMLSHHRRMDPEARLLWGLCEGVLISYMALLFLGLGGHNLYRYNWFFLAALVTVIYRITTRRYRAEHNGYTRTNEAEP